MRARGLWGISPDRGNGEVYNHVVGLKIVGEILPQEFNCVTLADETDQYGLQIPRITYYSWCDNDRRLINHSLAFVTQALDAVDAKHIWRQNDDTCHLYGTARMRDDPLTSPSMPIAEAVLQEISCDLRSDLHEAGVDQAIADDDC